MFDDLAADLDSVEIKESNFKKLSRQRVGTIPLLSAETNIDSYPDKDILIELNTFLNKAGYTIGTDRCLYNITSGKKVRPSNKPKTKPIYRYYSKHYSITITFNNFNRDWVVDYRIVDSAPDFSVEDFTNKMEKEFNSKVRCPEDWALLVKDDTGKKYCKECLARKKLQATGSMYK